MKIEVAVKIGGAFFDSDPEKIVDTALEELRHELADQAREHIFVLGTQNFENSTGNYFDHLVVEKTVDSDIITDSEIVYGPWLERGATGQWGAGFTGYQLWEKTFLWTENSAKRIAQGYIDRAIDRLS